MRIVSQNRNLSVDFGNCEIWTQSNVIYRRIGNNSEVLGAYATPERAMEVFEDIHKAYAPVGIITSNLNEEQAIQFVGSSNVAMNVIQMDEPDMGVATYDNYVYYMPEK